MGWVDLTHTHTHTHTKGQAWGLEREEGVERKSPGEGIGSNSRCSRQAWEQRFACLMAACKDGLWSKNAKSWLIVKHMALLVCSVVAKMHHQVL